jgi:hypothetical protein
VVLVTVGVSFVAQGPSTTHREVEECREPEPALEREVR